MANVQYPCRNCIYFKACGDNMRTTPCEGACHEKRKEKRGEKQMNVIKMYCGLMFVEYNGEYLCIDHYANKAKCRGTYEECNAYYSAYVDRLANRD